MDEVTLKLDEKGHGGFYYTEGGEPLGEMVVWVSDSALTVYHTGVVAQAEGRGVAKELLNAMVAYVRKKGLKVIALCPYVQAQFKRHPEAYADVWNQAHQNEGH
jgi:uncharacterized protein